MPQYTAKPPLGADDPNNPTPDALLAPAAAATPSATTPGIIAGAQAPTPTAAAPDATPPSGIIGAAQAPAATPDYTGQIQGAYQKYLGRTGDQAGIDFFKNAMAGGASMDTINNDFTSSDEYKALHPQAASGIPAGTPQLGAPGQWNVTPEQTVAGQMKSLIDPNNPYYQQWATTGAQDAAARGFTGNSSIRDSGILDAVMRGALPIATADAATHAKSAGYNADMPNQFAMKNADLGMQNTLAHLSADTQLAVQKMSAASQQTISAAHDANAVLIQSNDAAKSAYGNYVAAIAQIDQNEKMDEAAKRAAIITQTQIFNNAISGMKSATPGTADVGSPLDINQMAAANAAAGQVGGVDVSNMLRGF